jgi:hypothetical protein
MKPRLSQYILFAAAIMALGIVSSNAQDAPAPAPAPKPKIKQAEDGFTPPPPPFIAKPKLKPRIKLAEDGFPTGHETPEGVAADMSRAFVKNDAAMFKPKNGSSAGWVCARF